MTKLMYLNFLVKVENTICFLKHNKFSEKQHLCMTQGLTWCVFLHLRTAGKK